MDLQPTQISTVESVRLLNFKRIERPDGSLVALNNSKEIPFDVKRVFYIHGGCEGKVERGKHAHKQCLQLLICMHGACEVVCDDGMAKRTFILDNPSCSVFVPAGIWATEKYLAPGTILLVLADRVYEEDDYIRNYEQFLVFRQRLTSGMEHKAAAHPRKDL